MKRDIFANYYSTAEVLFSCSSLFTHNSVYGECHWSICTLTMVRSSFFFLSRSRKYHKIRLQHVHFSRNHLSPYARLYVPCTVFGAFIISHFQLFGITNDNERTNKQKKAYTRQRQERLIQLSSLLSRTDFLRYISQQIIISVNRHFAFPWRIPLSRKQFILVYAMLLFFSLHVRIASYFVFFLLLLIRTECLHMS